MTARLIRAAALAAAWISPAAAGDASTVPLPLTPLQEEARRAEAAGIGTKAAAVPTPPPEALPGSAADAPPADRFDRSDRR